MFLENASEKGWIEVICGSMFSGKTEELIRRLRRAEFEVVGIRYDRDFWIVGGAGGQTHACGKGQ